MSTRDHKDIWNPISYRSLKFNVCGYLNPGASDYQRLRYDRLQFPASHHGRRLSNSSQEIHDSILKCITSLYYILLTKVFPCSFLLYRSCNVKCITARVTELKAVVSYPFIYTERIDTSCCVLQWVVSRLQANRRKDDTEHLIIFTRIYFIRIAWFNLSKSTWS